VAEFENFRIINDFTKSFMKKYNECKAQLPYHINVIDLLRANENAHSRILLKLLQQSHKSKYEIPESFVNEFIVDFEHKIEKPVFSAETYRIDLLIREKNKYAIIFENKIHNAVLQKNQLARYIDKIKQLEYSVRQIYVVYLPPDNHNKPKDCSWRVEGKCCKECDRNIIAAECKNLVSYEELFKDRYYSLSFNDHILPWLKENVISKCRVADFLSSAIIQYIDHLEKILGLRKKDRKMNIELNDFLNEELNFNESPENNISILNAKLREIALVNDQLNSLKNDTHRECWLTWLNRLRTEFPQYAVIDEYIDDDEYVKVGVIMKYKEYSFSILIETNFISIYYGIGRHKSSIQKTPEISAFVQPALDNNGIKKSSEWWYGYKNTSYENGYYRLKTMIEETRQLLNNSI
jgi:hypothetical protein